MSEVGEPDSHTLRLSPMASCFMSKHISKLAHVCHSAQFTSCHIPAPRPQEEEEEEEGEGEEEEEETNPSIPQPGAWSTPWLSGVREGGSATFQVLSSHADAVLRQSGRQGVFYKIHQSEGQQFELLWSPEGTTKDEAIALAQSNHHILRY
eukprot:57398-Amphidinium_carterae.1